MNTSRIEAVDALRGYAIFSIMLLHNLEHFDFYYLPETLPIWMKSLDLAIWDTLFFIFAGKSYAIFALLFGLTFYIQHNSPHHQNKNFAARYAWRLLLLFLFGIINSMFYEGDVLTFYACLGFILIPIRNFSNKALLFLALAFLLQPLELAKLVYCYNHPDFVLPKNQSGAYFAKLGDYLGGSSFLKTIQGNLTNGKPAVIFWMWESGRIFQIPALFIIGLLLGRTHVFENPDSRKNFWIKTLLISAVSFALLYPAKLYAGELLKEKTYGKVLKELLGGWSNIALMFFIVSLFVSLYTRPSIERILKKINSAGRMTLTNYIIQSLIGSLIYYGYGFGLYKYTGATYSLLIGLVLFALQLRFSKWWLKTHKQGPLEYIWSKATWY